MTELTFAASTLLRESGNYTAAKIIEEVKNPSKASEIQQVLNLNSIKQKETTRYTPDEALCLTNLMKNCL